MNSEQKEKYAIKILSYGHFTLDAYSGFLDPIMPFIAAKIGITMTAATVIIGISNIISSCSQPFVGYIADKWRRRFFIFWGMLFASIFLSMLGLAKNIVPLSCFIILGNIGIAFYHPQATSFVLFYSKAQNLCKNMSYFIAMGTIGYALGPAISSWIAAKCGIANLCYAAIPGVLFAFLLLLIVPKVKVNFHTKNEVNLLTALNDIFSNKVMFILILASTVKSFISSAFTITLPFYWKSIGYNVASIGTILFLFMLSGSLGVLTSPYLEKKFGIRKTFYISLLTVLPLTLLFYYLQNINQIASLSVLMLIEYACFLAVPINMSMAQQIMPQYKSMTAGFIGGFSWGVIGLVLPFLSMIAEKIGILKVLIIVAFIPLVFAYFIKYLPERENV